MIACFGFLSTVSIYRMIVSYGSNDLDISVLTMQLICKLTYAGWSIHNLALKESGKLKESDGKVISRYPTILEYFGYCFSFIGMVGPSIDLDDYLDWINQEVSIKIYHLETNLNRTTTKRSKPTGKLTLFYSHSLSSSQGFIWY